MVGGVPAWWAESLHGGRSEYVIVVLHEGLLCLWWVEGVL